MYRTSYYIQLPSFPPVPIWQTSITTIAVVSQSRSTSTVDWFYSFVFYYYGYSDKIRSIVRLHNQRTYVLTKHFNHILYYITLYIYIYVYWVSQQWMRFSIILNVNKRPRTYKIVRYKNKKSYICIYEFIMYLMRSLVSHWFLCKVTYIIIVLYLQYSINENHK